MSFLEMFLPNRQEATRQYGIPQFAENPNVAFDSADDLINYLEQHSEEIHAIYWLNKEAATLRGAMCIFTSDGNLIAGLYCETLRPDRRNEIFYLEKLMAFCESTTGLIEYEQPAAQDTQDFLKRVNKFKQHMSI